jgi:hypothetical protein
MLEPWLSGAHHTKDCIAYRRWLTEKENKKAMNNNKCHKEDDHDREGFPNVEDIMFIFGEPKAYEDRW